MKLEMFVTEKPQYSKIIDIPEILISNIEQMQVGFVLSSSASKTPDYPDVTHAHDNFELQYIVDNDVEILVDNSRKLKLNEGDLLLLPPHLYHKVCENSSNHKHYCINFSVLPNQYILSNEQVQTIEFRNQTLASVEQELVFRNTEIQNLILKIFESDSGNLSLTLKNKLYLNVIFEEIITHLSNKNVSVSEPQPIDATHLINMQRKWIIEKYISHYYMYRNHTENLSQILGLSPRQSSRVVKELTGSTLQELILTQRMVVAMESIKFSDMSLTQIADMLGYSTYYGFYTAFCKYYGFSPEQSSKLNKIV